MPYFSHQNDPKKTILRLSWYEPLATGIIWEHSNIMPWEAIRHLLYLPHPTPQFKIGDDVRIKWKTQRFRIKGVSFCELGDLRLGLRGSFEYILEDMGGNEVHTNDPLAWSSFSEGILEPAESFLEEFINLQKAGKA